MFCNLFNHIAENSKKDKIEGLSKCKITTDELNISKRLFISDMYSKL